MLEHKIILFQLYIQTHKNYLNQYIIYKREREREYVQTSHPPSKIRSLFPSITNFPTNKNQHR